MDEIPRIAPITETTVNRAPVQEKAPVISAEFQRKMERQNPANRSVIGFTDIDGTWENASDKGPNPASTEVKKALDQNNIPLVAVTGRSVDLVDNDPKLSPNFPFDAVFSAVGTELWIPHIATDGKRTFTIDPDWDNHVKNEIGFKRDGVYPVCVKIKDMINTEHPTSQLAFQPRDTPENVAEWNAFNADNTAEKPAENEPQPYKISYTFSGTLADAAEIKSRFLAELGQVNYEKVKVVVSQEKKTGAGDILKFNVDVVPVAKADAVTYLAQRTKKELNLPQDPLTMYAGDSGNDIDPMSVADVGIIVGGPKQSDFDSWISGLQILKKSRSGNFFTVQDPETHSTRLIFREQPGSHREGPESLNNARRQIQMLAALQRN